MKKLKKYVIFLLIIIITILTRTNLISIASTTATTDITVDSKNAIQGKDVIVNIVLNNKLDFSAANFTLTYDSTVLEYKNLTIGDVLKTNNGTTEVNGNKKGEIKIGYISYANQTNNTKNEGNMFSITFNVKSGSVATTDINLQATTLKKADGTNVNTSIKNGKLTIISGIKLNQTDLTLEMGKNSTLSVSTIPTATNLNNETISWESTNMSVATVTSNGTITPIAPGKTQIIAKVLGLQATCNITVIAPLQSISLTETIMALVVGDTKALSVSYNPANTTDNKNITWTSSNKNVANVDTNGKITAVAPGQALITATVGNKQATCTVTVFSMIGDFDRDREITAYDAYKVLETSINIMLGTNPEEEIIYISDFDKDGEITAQDAYKILEYSVGL